MGTPPAGPPPAWYDNPTGDGVRYWDGGAWTDHVARERGVDPAASTPSGSPPSGGGHVPWYRVASSSTARVLIDLGLVAVLALVIVVGIASTDHDVAKPIPIVEAAGGSSTTSVPSTTEVPTTQAVPTTVAPTTVPTTVPPTTIPPTTVPPTTVPPTTVPMTVPRTTTSATTPAPKPAPPQTLLTESNEGNETTTAFVVPSNATAWDVQWTYNCSANGGTGTFSVAVLNGTGRDPSDAPVIQSGGGGSGTQYYLDQGTFSLQITSDCIWSIQAAVP